jgi:hypothetical protein
VELAIFSGMFQCELSVTDVQSGRVDVYGEGSGYTRRCYMFYTGKLISPPYIFLPGPLCGTSALSSNY